MPERNGVACLGNWFIKELVRSATSGAAASTGALPRQLIFNCPSLQHCPSTAMSALRRLPSLIARPAPALGPGVALAQRGPSVLAQPLARLCSSSAQRQLGVSPSSLPRSSCLRAWSSPASSSSSLARSAAEALPRTCGRQYSVRAALTHASLRSELRRPAAARRRLDLRAPSAAARRASRTRCTLRERQARQSTPEARGSRLAGNSPSFSTRQLHKS